MSTNEQSDDTAASEAGFLRYKQVWARREADLKARGVKQPVISLARVAFLTGVATGAGQPDLGEIETLKLCQALAGDLLTEAEGIKL